MKKNIIIAISLFLLLWGCNKAQDWGDLKDNVPPGMVSNTAVENLNGGANITYTLPSDKDLLGVKAIYTFKKGEELREAFTSAYNDTITLKGFPDTIPHSVSLISVDKSYNESEPVIVSIQPLTPPVELIRQSLKVSNTFGGVYAQWENISQDEISIWLYTTDSLGEFKLADTYYTSLTNGGYSFRGFDDTERGFHFEIRDRYDNYATNLDTILKPLYEEEITPKDEFGAMVWDRYGFADKTTEWMGDIIYDHPAGTKPWTQAVDGITISKDCWISTNYGNLLSFWDDDVELNSKEDKDMWPMYFTLDLGNDVMLSRHKLWHRGRNIGTDYLNSGNRYYQQGNFKRYEIWASDTPPRSPNTFANKKESLAYWTSWPEVGGTDGWKNDWVKICDCECIPPSGATVPDQLTVDDIIYADDGFETEVPPNLTGTKFRYVRFVLKQLWYDSAILQCGEIKFYGAYSK